MAVEQHEGREGKGLVEALRKQRRTESQELGALVERLGFEQEKGRLLATQLERSRLHREEMGLQHSRIQEQQATLYRDHLQTLCRQLGVNPAGSLEEQFLEVGRAIRRIGK